MTRLAAGVVCASLVATPARAQVAAVLVAFHDQQAETFAMSRTPSTVTVTIWKSLADSTPVQGLIAPRQFHVGPGEKQTIRVRLAAPCDPHMRFVVLFTPDAPSVVKRERGVTASITVATRLVSRVRCA